MAETVTTFRICLMGLMRTSVASPSSIDRSSAALSPASSSSRRQPLRGILGLPLVPHLEVEARSLEGARVPDRSDRLTLGDLVAFLDLHLGHVGVERVIAAPVIHDDHVPIAPEPARVEHAAGVYGHDARPLRDVDVDPVPERLGPEPGVDLRAVLA